MMGVSAARERSASSQMTGRRPSSQSVAQQSAVMARLARQRQTAFRMVGGEEVFFVREEE